MSPRGPCLDRCGWELQTNNPNRYQKRQLVRAEWLSQEPALMKGVGVRLVCVVCLWIRKRLTRTPLEIISWGIVCR